MTYTPTTESVRRLYLELSETVSGSQEIAQGNVEYFDRWYAEEIRKAKHDAWEEGAKTGYRDAYEHTDTHNPYKEQK